MKIKRLKGFTLIECIVAMAIIGVTSLLMVQVYGTIAKMNRDNNSMNNSMEKQMEYVEKELKKNETGDTAVKITCISTYNNADADSKNNSGVKITFKPKTDTAATNKTKFKDTIEADVDLYVIGVDVVQDSKTDKVYNKDNTVRYKFILPRTDDDPT